MNVYSKSGGGGSSTQWTSAGCYVDANSRMLRSYTTRQAGMTNDQCISTCSSQGYTIAGTEDGQECYCGTQVYRDGGAGVSAPSSDCGSPCGGATIFCTTFGYSNKGAILGNSGQICGGGWRISIFLKPGTTI